MRMKADVEIVTGFIGSGKTSFVNALIQNTIVDKEKIVIIQCETGETIVEEKLQNHRAVIVKSCNEEKPFTEEYIKYILDLYRPHRLIIEFNGTEIIYELLNSLQKKDFKKRCKLTTMFHISNVATFDLYLSNMSSMLLPPIQGSNLILLNNIEAISKEKLEDIQCKVKNLNSHAFIIETKNTSSIKDSIKQADILDKGFSKKLRIYMKNSLCK